MINHTQLAPVHTELSAAVVCVIQSKFHYADFATFTETSWFHDLSPFVSTTVMICVCDFPRGEVSVKVSVVEFGLKANDGVVCAIRAWF